MTTAMGATAAAVWRLENESGEAETEFRLLSSLRMPAELTEGDGPSQAHRRILECVVSEGQPILVPPASVKVEAARPVNPLSDALIIIPIRIQDSIDLIVEVVQRPTGGPTAQRGYLRFVAQMSDLLSDFQRQHQLRALTHGQQFIQQVEDCLSGVASSESKEQRYRIAIDSLRNIFDSEHAMLVARSRKAAVTAIAGTGSFDPRSELLLGVAQFASDHQFFSEDADGNSLQVFDARDRREDPQAQEGESEDDVADEISAADEALERLCEQLGCRRVLLLALGRQHKFVALLTFAANDIPWSRQLPASQSSLCKLARSVGCLLESQAQPSRLQALRGSVQAPKTHQSRFRLWGQRLAIIVGLVAVALVPVPQRIRADATLHPASKRYYYAPAAGLVADVRINPNGHSKDDVLLILKNDDLIAETNGLEALAAELEDSLQSLNAQLGKGSDMSRQQVAQLEKEMAAYELELDARLEELRLRKQDVESLTIRASADGRVSSGELKNELLGCPVEAGDLLVTDFQEDGDWYFDVAIPEHRIGIVSQAMNASDSDIEVRLSLSGFPEQILVGKLSRLDSQSASVAQTIQQVDSEKALMARVEIDGSLLPSKKDGHSAIGSIDCGRVPLVWLVFRDAYCQLSSRIRMLW